MFGDGNIDDFIDLKEGLKHRPFLEEIAAEIYFLKF